MTPIHLTYPVPVDQMTDYPQDGTDSPDYFTENNFIPRLATFDSQSGPSSSLESSLCWTFDIFRPFMTSQDQKNSILAVALYMVDNIMQKYANSLSRLILSKINVWCKVFMWVIGTSEYLEKLANWLGV